VLYIYQVDFALGSRQDNHDIDPITSQIKLFIFDITFPL